ncbi:MAG: hypothetical protein K2W95_33780 [Candidatus Obscuribacterales bacterium]|nr:hypothetical protein [Candidatus Obscuribacterales bacterium]
MLFTTAHAGKPGLKARMSAVLALVMLLLNAQNPLSAQATCKPPENLKDVIVPVNSEFIDSDSERAELPLLASAGVSEICSVPIIASATSGDQRLELKERIEKLTREILLKEIALERFNLNYTSNAAKQGRWKGLRYAFWQEANSGCGIAGGIIGTVERGRNIHTSKKVRPCIQQQANFIPMIGSIIGASAAAIEMGINQFHEIQASRHGFSPSLAKAHVGSLKQEIDHLMAQRAALVQEEQADPATEACGQADALEGKVLIDLRDLSLLEYQRFHLGARKTIAFQQCQYFFDIAKNTTNAIGAQFAFMALHRGDRRWNLRAGILYQIAGGLTIAGPILSRSYAEVVSLYHKRGLREHLKDVETKETSVLSAHQAALEKACRGRDEATRSMERLAAYADQAKVFQDGLDKASKDREKSRLTATQNVGAGIFVGGCKLASGTLFVIPGGHQRYNSKTATATRVTNHLLFSSGVVGLSASSFSFVDTLRIQAQGEINRHRLASQGKLPGQQIAARLKQLDALEISLKASGN